MISIELLITIQADKRTEFLQAFDMIKSGKLKVGGRLDLELFERVNEANTFLWREHWDTPDSLEEYFQGNQFRAMMGAINILGKLVHKKLFSYEGEGKHG